MRSRSWVDHEELAPSVGQRSRKCDVIDEEQHPTVKPQDCYGLSVGDQVESPECDCRVLRIAAHRHSPEPWTRREIERTDPRFRLKDGVVLHAVSHC